MVKVAARRWGYGFRDVPRVDQGEFFESEALTDKEQRMLDMGYLSKLSPKAVPLKCRECGRKFAEASNVENHGRRAHGRALSEEAKDKRIERDETIMQSAAPLYLDKTSASKGVRRRAAR